MKFPLAIKRAIGTRGQIAGYQVTDAYGRYIHLPCEEDPIRRGVVKLWSPEEAEALAKRIARMLTDEEEKG